MKKYNVHSGMFNRQLVQGKIWRDRIGQGKFWIKNDTSTE